MDMTFTLGEMGDTNDGMKCARREHLSGFWRSLQCRPQNQKESSLSEHKVSE